MFTQFDIMLSRLIGRLFIYAAIGMSLANAVYLIHLLNKEKDQEELRRQLAQGMAKVKPAPDYEQAFAEAQFEPFDPPKKAKKGE